MKSFTTVTTIKHIQNKNLCTIPKKILILVFVQIQSMYKLVCENITILSKRATVTHHYQAYCTVFTHQLPFRYHFYKYIIFLLKLYCTYLVLYFNWISQQKPLFSIYSLYINHSYNIICCSITKIHIHVDIS